MYDADTCSGEWKICLLYHCRDHISWIVERLKCTMYIQLVISVSKRPFLWGFNLYNICEYKYTIYIPYIYTLSTYMGYKIIYAYKSWLLYWMALMYGRVYRVVSRGFRFERIICQYSDPDRIVRGGPQGEQISEGPRYEYFRNQKQSRHINYNVHRYLYCFRDNQFSWAEKFLRIFLIVYSRRLSQYCL